MIDEDDRRVMKRFEECIQKKNGSTYMTPMEYMVEIREEDEEQRVYKFRMPGNAIYLPEFILELDALEELTEVEINKFPQRMCSFKNLKVLTDDRIRAN